MDSSISFAVVKHQKGKQDLCGDTSARTITDEKYIITELIVTFHRVHFGFQSLLLSVLQAGVDDRSFFSHLLQHICLP